MSKCGNTTGFTEMLLEDLDPLEGFAVLKALGSTLAFKEMREIQEDQTTQVFLAQWQTPKVWIVLPTLWGPALLQPQVIYAPCSPNIVQLRPQYRQPDSGPPTIQCSRYAYP